MEHVLDHAATVVGVTSLCNLHWIAVWALMDCLVYPQNVTVSVILSWILGYAIVSAALFYEPRSRDLSRTFEKRGANWKVLFEDADLVVANIGVILVWRGWWMYFESLAYYFPIYHGSFDVTSMYSNLSAFAMLCLCYASATAVLKGCDFDGQMPDGEGVTFSLDYFSDFFREQIQEEEGKETEGDKPADSNYNYDKSEPEQDKKND